MKANSLIKKSIDIEEVFKNIESLNEQNYYKHAIPENIYVSNEVKLELLENGFKVYTGDMDIMKNCLVIEW